MKIDYPILVICQDCGKHGFFILSDSTRSPGFTGKDAAHFIFDQIQELYDVDIYQVYSIKEEINQSQLSPIGQELTTEIAALAMRVAWRDLQASNPDILESELEPICQIRTSEIFNQWPSISGN